jgi:DNA-binding CsgD family transcriptional regulator
VTAAAPSSPARLMADTLAMLKRLGVTDRAVFDGILRTTLESHPRYLGVWSIWEPNALDGRDRDFVNRAGHDGTGRYVPLWNRGRGAIAVEPNSYYETPGVGEFYLRPRREGREALIDPYVYPVGGAPRLIMTQGAPVFFEGRCVGAAGIDIAIDEIPTSDLQGADNDVECLLDRGFVFLGPGGRVSYCSARSRRLLARFVGPSSPGQLPEGLRRLLETDSGPSSLTFQDHGGGLASELEVRPFDHPSTGRGLVLIERTGAPAATALSLREGEVLGWMTRGKTNGEIAAILGISLHTVKRHVEKILQKLGVPNRSAAAAAQRQAPQAATTTR